MGFKPVTLAVYAERYMCEAHGMRSSECKDIHRLVGIVSMATTGASLGAAVGGKEGAAWGGLIFGFLGVAYPEFADWLRMNGVLEEPRSLALR